MRGDGDIVEVFRRVDRRLGRCAIDDLGELVEDLDAGFLKFHPHQNRQEAAKKAGGNGEKDIERADILVIGRE